MRGKITIGRQAYELVAKKERGIMSYLVAKIAAEQRFLNQVKTHAIRRQRTASERERTAMRTAYDSLNEELWGIADKLVDAIDAGGRHYRRVRLCQQIEEVTE